MDVMMVHRFPSSDRWAFFPSGSLGYRFSEEPYFMKLKNIIGNGKFRASYGEIGNQAVGKICLSPLFQG